VEAFKRKKFSAGVNKPAEMQVNRIYVEEEAHCLQQISGSNPQAIPKRSRGKTMEQTDMDRGQGHALTL
jgi:hypothetical protein